MSFDTPSFLFIFLRAEATVRLSRFHSAKLTFHMFFLK